jgi:hypothetical protein
VFDLIRLGHILGGPLRIRFLARRRRLVRGPIIFDFKAGRVYRSSKEDQPDLVRDMEAALKKRGKPKVVKTVEGVPPQVTHQKT